MARHRDDPETAAAAQSRPTGRRRTIRSRLIRIIALPLVAVAVLLAVVVVGDTNAYRSASQTNRSVRLLLEAGNVVHYLQQERGVVAGLLGGDVSFKAEMTAARSHVDIERATLRRLAADPDGKAVATALDDLDELAGIRAKVDTNKIARADAFAYYTDRIAELTSIDVGVERSSDETLRRSVSALQALDDLKEDTAQERAFLNGVFAAGGFKAAEYQTFARIDAQQQAALDRYRLDADPAQMAFVTDALDTGAASEATFFKQRALAAVNRPFVVSPQSWWSANTTLLDDMRAAQVWVGADISGRAADLQSTATLRLSGLGLLALLSAVGASVLLAAATHSITRPLATLAAEARAIAEVGLPEAVARARSVAPDVAPDPPPRVVVPRRSSTEILAVADALDSAQATAFNLATEQARLLRSTSESLANLGRRNQNLLRRQLGFITRLEREETDPSGLANLFELDHLATRMRRNAESLLVLVGESRPRTWSEPVPVADVLRAAISEVEDYRRVTLRRLDDGYVGGAFVAGVAHVIAELVENGLAFSPPDVDVEIQGRLIRGQYLIGITDQGIGMDRADMDRANARLRGEESFLTAPTRYLGHYVVGQLARQMGIDVELTQSPVTGVTARVILSAPVLTHASRADSSTALAIGRARTPTEQPMDDLVEASAAGWFDGPVTGSGDGPVVIAGNRPSVVSPRLSISADTFAVDVAHGRGERTRNGLLKRVPGLRRPIEAQQPGPVWQEPPPGPRTRDTLNLLRAGVARGTSDYAANTSPEPSSSLWDSETERSTHVH